MTRPSENRSRLIHRLRWLPLAALGVAYVVFAHLSTAAARADFAGALVAVGPLLGFAFLLAWRSRLRAELVGLVGALTLALWAGWDFIEHHFSWVYFLQHAGTNALLGIVFGRSLFAGRTPFCTQLAVVVHPRGVPTIVVRYTRQVTQAWTAFFLASAALSVLLFAFAPIEIWSLFANLLAMPLVGLMFAAEYLVRCRILPPEHRPGLIETARAYMASGKPDGSSSETSR